MLSSSPKQPSKRRRLSLRQHDQPGPSSEVLPLVLPHLVPKSSKDPNRNLYPRKREKKGRGSTFPCSSFTKASALLKSPSKEEKKSRVSSFSCSSFTKASALLKSPSKEEKKGRVSSLPCSSFTKASTLLKSPSKEEKKRRVSSFSCSSFTKASALLKSPSKEEKKGRISSFPCSSFIKASALLKSESPRRRKRETKHVDKDKDIICLDDVSQNETAKFDDYPKVGIKSRLRSHKEKLQGPISNKIINYFKPSTRAKRCSSSESTSSSDIQVIASTSGRRNVNEDNEKFFKRISNFYGLLGENSNEARGDRTNYFERLPVHIIETILCQIPILDLMNCRFVCLSWNEIISDKKFVEWKKTYYGIKYKNPDYHTHMENVGVSIPEVDDCFSALIRYMANGFCRKPSTDMIGLMEKTLKGIDAKNVMIERFPDLMAKESCAWCVLATAVLLSETVWDVYSLYKCLFSSNSECSLHDVTDALYCIATFLLWFKNVYNINHGLHYRVYYTLYLIENNLPPEKCSNVQSLKVPKGISGQQSLHNYSDYGYAKSQLTYEQIRILNHCLQPKQVVKIIALAGTGKTTTLVHFARMYPQIQFLNVMFNKAVCDDAKRKFPPNVTCRTAHSLAYKFHGTMLRHKFSLKLRPHDLVKYLENCKGTHLHTYSYAKHVLTTIENFTASADKELSLEHVPLSCKDASRRCIENPDRQKLLKDALTIWQKLIDRDDKFLKATHDVYLKLYQISSPKLSAYKCILVDEAQDCNAAMLDIVLSQNLPVILVGDPNQQIYGFRGATNALQGIQATHTYYLTKSFRFGPQIAYIASCCLEVLKSNNRDTLVGNTRNSSINGETAGQYAIIARTNVQLFNEAVRLCCEKLRRPNEPIHILGAFAGGIKGYGFDQILDISLLRKKTSRSGNSKDGDNIVISDKFISKFRCFTDLWNYARGADDADLLSKIELVNQHGANISNYIKIIKEKCCHPIELANVVFATAHKSKGLEFDTVCLTDDYHIGRLPYEVDSGAPTAEEASILYVSLTRAKKCLLLPEKVLKFLLAAQEKFEYPVSSKSLLKDNPELKCISCSDHFVPHTAMVLARRSIITANGRMILGGPLCMRCATEPMVRPQVHLAPLVMYLDPTDDFAHRTMSCFVGPLSTDPPVAHNSSRDLHDMRIVYVININL